VKHVAVSANVAGKPSPALSEPSAYPPTNTSSVGVVTTAIALWPGVTVTAPAFWNSIVTESKTFSGAAGSVPASTNCQEAEPSGTAGNAPQSCEKVLPCAPTDEPSSTASGLPSTGT
jgi:hypothetical protein